eukprot:COSAG01_NODE_5460_length_4252_cov_7.235974_4_plen_219_part_00
MMRPRTSTRDAHRRRWRQSHSWHIAGAWGDKNTRIYMRVRGYEGMRVRGYEGTRVWQHEGSRVRGYAESSARTIREHGRPHGQRAAHGGEPQLRRRRRLRHGRPSRRGLPLAGTASTWQRRRGDSHRPQGGCAATTPNNLRRRAEMVAGQIDIAGRRGCGARAPRSRARSPSSICAYRTQGQATNASISRRWRDVIGAPRVPAWRAPCAFTPPAAACA